MPPAKKQIKTAKMTLPLPPTKKQKMTAKSGISPKEAHSKRLDKAIDDYRCIGTLLIVGVDSDESSGEEDGTEEDDTKEYTAAEIAKLRHILINDSRDMALAKAEKFTGGTSISGTSEGTLVVIGVPGEIAKALRKRSIPASFDHLFALTYHLQSYDYWMHDNECWEPGHELEQAVRALARAWRYMLTHSNEELGIDGEFTRPGIMALLSNLEDDFRACETTEHFPFQWRP